MVGEITYQLRYEICSLVFLFALTLQFISARKFPTRTNHVFAIILICSVFDLALDILGCLTVMNIVMVPLWLNYLINGVFYCLQISIPALTSIYVLLAMGCTFKTNPRSYLIMVPASAFLLMQLMNPFTKMFFYFEVIDGVAIFRYGPFSLLFYACAAFYVFALMALIIIYRLRLTRKQITTVLFFCVIVTTAMIVQILHPDLILTGTAITVSIMLWDLTLQNPENMVDEETGVFNSPALRLFIEGRIRFGKVYATVIDISGMSSTEREIGDRSSSVMMKRIGSYLTTLSPGRIWCFRDSRTRFWIGAKSSSEMEQVSSKVVERFNNPWDAGGINIDLMAKVLSVRTSSSIKTSTPELISVVDEVLDEETSFTGQKRTVDIDSSHLARHRRRQILEESIRRSIKTGEGFYLCFQPIIDLNDSKKTMAEVLLRYNDPNLGGVSPVEFMPVIEQSGMAVFIDSLVVDQASKFLAEHPEIGSLHINLSAAEFFHNPIKRISETVLKNGAAPNRICFEITESAAAKSSDMLMSFMTQMIRLGFSFALDDYGTGYSNIIQVMNLPFSTVKIDKGLLDDEDKGAKFLESTIKLFKDLEIEPVIEGVESKTLLDRVRQYGASMIQGFLYSPPLTENDYLKFIKNGNRTP